MLHAARLLLFALVLAVAAPAAAEGFVQPMPEDLDQVDVYLLTVGRGPQVHALFGHTMLRVVDRKRRLDVSYNWGIFDFDDPGFIWKFYKGDLNYQLAVSTDFRALLEHYRRYERRSMVQEKINLTKAQKETLLRRIIENSRPENIHYAYSQLRDNCATRPRDHLDETLKGRIREVYDHAPTGTTYRYWMLHGASAAWWAYLGLDMLTNDVMDRPITPWEEMFLPGRLRAHLRDLPAFDDNGDPIPGSLLLTETTTLIPLPEPPPARDPYAVAAVAFGLPLTLVALALVRRRSAFLEPGRLLAPVFGLLTLLYGLWSAVWGVLLAANWALSSYIEAQHNALLLLYWPIDWVFVAYGAHLLFKRRLPDRASRLFRWTRLLAALHLLVLVVAVVLELVGILRQDVLASLASFGVAAGVLFAALVCCGSNAEA